jgi:hypothetical protein
MASGGRAAVGVVVAMVPLERRPVNNEYCVGKFLDFLDFRDSEIDATRAVASDGGR